MLTQLVNCDSAEEVICSRMADAIGQSSSNTDSFGDLAGCLYVYTRADGRVVTRTHPYATLSIPEWQRQQEPRAWRVCHEPDDISTGGEERESKSEERKNESKLVS
jgi:hypothetical protein